MADFMDFFLIGDGESSVPAAMEAVRQFRKNPVFAGFSPERQRKYLLWQLATTVPGIYVPQFYRNQERGKPAKVKAIDEIFTDAEQVILNLPDKLALLPERILRETVPLTDTNQPINSLVPYLSLVHDREVLEVRRGCDRGCRFCQPGYTFLPVRERASEIWSNYQKKQWPIAVTKNTCFCLYASVITPP